MPQDEAWKRVPDEDELTRLSEDWDEGRSQVEQYQSTTRAILDEMAGANYVEPIPNALTPLNLTEILYSTLMQNLITSGPRAVVRAKYDPRRKPYANKWQLALNERMERMRLKDELRACVQDAIIGIGLMVVDSETVNVTYEDEEYDLRRAFARRIDADDWCHEPFAKTWNRAVWYGYRFSADLESIQDAKGWRNTKDLSEEQFAVHSDTHERVDSISRGNKSRPRQRYRDTVRLRRIFLRDRNIWIVVPDADPTTVCYAEIWTGRPEGPFRRLNFGQFPSQLWPHAPARVLFDMHKVANEMMRKVIKGAKTQKDLMLVRADSTAEKDANNIMRAPTGAVLNVMDPSNSNHFRVGGADPQTVQLVVWFRQMYSWAGGNLDLMAGLGAQSDTATQDAMLMRAAAGRVRTMQSALHEFANEVMQSLAWFVAQDPLLYERGEINVPGVGRVPIDVTADDIRAAGDMSDYHFDIEAASLTAKTAQERSAAAMQFVQQVMLPMAQVFMQQGVQIDLVQMVRLFADMQGIPELADLVSVGTTEQSAAEPAGRSGRAMQSPVTTRTNVRVSRGGGNQMQDADQAMLNATSGQETS